MKPKANQKTYEAYADIYDAFKGDRSAEVRFLRELISRHRPKTATLLEIACGTGSIAQGLSQYFEVFGLDNSPNMLRIAATKLSKARLAHADMINFKLNRTFDGIYCVHNSVNHLVLFKDWERMFRSVAAHLQRDGLFIFDVNPIERLDMLTKLGLGAKQVGDDYTLTQVTKDPETHGRYDWHMKIFLRQSQNDFILEHETLKISSYPISWITKALLRDFHILDYFVRDTAERFDDVGRAYYVCVKR